jgi:arsenate reductase
VSPADRQLRVHSLASCGTCRRALTWLRERGIPFELVAIDSQPPAAADLQRAMELFGRGRLFNTSGQSYRALGADQVRAMDDEQALAALSKDPRLIRRPFVVAGDAAAGGSILCGFKQEEWEQLLASDPD